MKSISKSISKFKSKIHTKFLNQIRRKYQFCTCLFILMFIITGSINILAKDISNSSNSLVSKNLESNFYTPLRLDIFSSILNINMSNNILISSSLDLSSSTSKKQVSATDALANVQSVPITINKNFTINNYTKFSNEMSMNINYPICEDEYISTIVHEKINSLANQFIYEFNGYTILPDAEVPKFNLNTYLYFLEDKVFFIKFEVDRSYIDGSNSSKYYDNYIYDLQSKSEISMNDFISGDYSNLFVQETKNYYLNNYNISLTPNSEQYKFIEPSEGNYNAIFVYMNIFEVAIYDYILEREILLNIDLSKVIPFIEEKYLPSTLLSNIQENTSSNTYIPTVTEASLSTEPPIVDVMPVQPPATIEVPQVEEVLPEMPSNIRELDKNKPMVALTFDDGPNKTSTNQILDILAQYDSLATFFVIGNRLDEQAETLIRTAELGHQIGNHTYSHPNLTTVSTEIIKNEIQISNDKIFSIVGQVPTIVRVPYGATNNNVKASIDYPIIAWNRDTRDWSSRNATAVKEAALETVIDGDIILMHDLYTSTAEACLSIVPELVNRGFQLVTIDELMYYRDIVLENSEVYSKAPSLINN